MRLGGVPVLVALMLGGGCEDPAEQSGDTAADSGAGETVVSDAVEPGDTAGGSDGDAGPDTGPDGGSDPASFAAFAARYDLLSTVAGRGDIEDKAVNGWLAGYEGGQAMAAELSRPHIALADDAGRIYIADKDAHAIRRVDVDGTIHTVAGTSVAGDDGDAPGPATARRLNAPNGLWVRGDGVFYVLDLGNSKVRKIDAAGVMTTLFTVDAGLTTGRGLQVAEDEAWAYVSSGSRLLRWRAVQGVTVAADGFISLANLAVLPGGAVLVADRGGHRVYRVDGDGRTAVVAGNGTADGGGDGAPGVDTGLDEVRAVWPVDGGRAMLLGTHRGSQVWYLDPGGLVHLLVDGRADDGHRGDGQHYGSPGKKVSEVRAVALAPNGDLLITENDRGFVRRVQRRR